MLVERFTRNRRKRKARAMRTNEMNESKPNVGTTMPGAGYTRTYGGVDYVEGYYLIVYVMTPIDSHWSDCNTSILFDDEMDDRFSTNDSGVNESLSAFLLGAGSYNLGDV